jgi:hypothetical protein
MANPNPSPSNQFQKGHPKIGNAGRKPGPNPFQKLLHDAVLEAAEQVGEVKVVEKTDKNGRVCRTTYEWNGKDALVGYLRFLAVYHPPTFAGLLGRVMPLHANVKTDTQVEVSYPTLEEARQALREHGFDPEVIEAARRPKFLEHRKDE